jgi:hypothetical protein
MRQAKFGIDLLQSSNQSNQLFAVNEEMIAWAFTPDPIWRMVMPGASEEGTTELSDLRITLRNGISGKEIINDTVLHLSSPRLYLLPTGIEMGTLTDGTPLDLSMYAANGAPIHWWSSTQARFYEYYQIDRDWVVGDGGAIAQRHYDVSIFTNLATNDTYPHIAPSNRPSADGRTFLVETRIVQPDFSWLDMIGTIGGTIALCYLIYRILFGSQRLKPWGLVHLIFRHRILSKVPYEVATCAPTPILTPPISSLEPSLDSTDGNTQFGSSSNTDEVLDSKEFKRLQHRVNIQQAEISQLREIAGALIAFQKRLDTFYLCHDFFYMDTKHTNVDPCSSVSQLAAFRHDMSSNHKKVKYRNVNALLPRVPELTQSTKTIPELTHSTIRYSTPIAMPFVEEKQQDRNALKGSDINIRHHCTESQLKQAQFWPEFTCEEIEVDDIEREEMISLTDILNEHLNYQHAGMQQLSTQTQVASRGAQHRR